MSWCKLDDQLHTHPKAMRAWKCRPALGLHLLALSYSAAQLTDGLVIYEFVEQKLPNRRERTAATAALVESGLWEPHKDGFVIHDYLDHNPARASVLAKRAADAERKARGRGTQSAQSPNGVRMDAHATPLRVVTESNGPVPGPSHTDTDPSVGFPARETLRGTSR